MLALRYLLVLILPTALYAALPPGHEGEESSFLNDIWLAHSREWQNCNDAADQIRARYRGREMPPAAKERLVSLMRQQARANLAMLDITETIRRFDAIQAVIAEQRRLFVVRPLTPQIVEHLNELMYALAAAQDELARLGVRVWAIRAQHYMGAAEDAGMGAVAEAEADVDALLQHA